MSHTSLYSSHFKWLPNNCHRPCQPRNHRRWHSRNLRSTDWRRCPPHRHWQRRKVDLAVIHLVPNMWRPSSSTPGGPPLLCIFEYAWMPSRVSSGTCQHKAATESCYSWPPTCNNSRKAGGGAGRGGGEGEQRSFLVNMLPRLFFLLMPPMKPILSCESEGY